MDRQGQGLLGFIDLVVDLAWECLGAGVKVACS